MSTNLARPQNTILTVPQVSRRSFLRLLGLLAPVVAAAPKYFFAPIGGWKSDVIVNPIDIAYMPIDTAMKFNHKLYDEITEVTLRHLSTFPSFTNFPGMA